MAVTPIYQLKTFEDIYTYVANELKVQLSDVESMRRIKRAINVTYIDEVVEEEYWPWLKRSLDLPFYARVTYTATFTNGSTTVTLGSAPSESVQGYLVSIRGQKLRVAEHTAGATTLQLESPFLGTSSASSLSDTAYIWSESLIMPTECRDVASVTHMNLNQPLTLISIQRYRELVTSMPENGGNPSAFTVAEFIDPSPFQTVSGMPSLTTSASAGAIRTLTFGGTITDYVQQGQRIHISGSRDYRYNGSYVISSVSGSSLTYTGHARFTNAAAADASLSFKVASVESTDESYQQLFLYPNALSQDLTVTVEYLRNVAPLAEDTDEPLMPVNDRIVLAYGALSKVWRSIARNPEEAQTSLGLFQEKLSSMASKIASTLQFPSLVPDKAYLARKRAPRSNRYNYWE